MWDTLGKVVVMASERVEEGLGVTHASGWTEYRKVRCKLQSRVLEGNASKDL